MNDPLTEQTAFLLIQELREMKKLLKKQLYVAKPVCITGQELNKYTIWTTNQFQYVRKNNLVTFNAKRVSEKNTGKNNLFIQPQ